MATVSCPTPPVAPATSTFSVEVITPAPQVLTGIWNKYIVVGNRESGIGSRESGIGELRFYPVVRYGTGCPKTGKDVENQG
ncbi:MAG: hypothetical protein F6K44_12595 [Moorea sp. SIO3E2]|nr:hypothetical protein [Moorena sp. SIO3E2]